VIPLPAARRALTARHLKTLLIIFGIRHLVGVSLFVWLTLVGRAAGGVGWMIVGGLGFAYAAVVAFNGSRLYRRYQNRVLAERTSG
jgi:hypothetical protein